VQFDTKSLFLEAIIHCVLTRCTSTLQHIDAHSNTERILSDIECDLSTLLCCRQYVSCFVIWCVESTSLLNFFAKRQNGKVSSVNKTTIHERYKWGSLSKYAEGLQKGFTPKWCLMLSTTVQGHNFCKLNKAWVWNCSVSTKTVCSVMYILVLNL
jgi:hypothetical protein